MPRSLSPAAKKQWKKIVPKLYRLGILNNADQTGLAMICVDLAEWENACRTIDSLKSEFVKQPSGRIAKHPAYQIRDAAADRIRKMLAEFGMSPAARTSLNISYKPAIDEDKAKFFRA
jgi:P27 family predicted phage terminase small subunit